MILVKEKSGCTTLKYSLNILMMCMIKTVFLMITGSTSGINTVQSRLETCPYGFQTTKKDFKPHTLKETTDIYAKNFNEAQHRAYSIVFDHYVQETKSQLILRFSRLCKKLCHRMTKRFIVR